MSLLLRGTLKLEGIQSSSGIFQISANVRQLLLDLGEALLGGLLGRGIGHGGVNLIGSLVLLKRQRQLLVLQPPDLGAKLVQLLVPDLNGIDGRWGDRFGSLF